MTAKRATQAIGEMRTSMGEKKFSLLLEAVSHMNAVVNDVLSELENSGFITADTRKLLQAGDRYSPYVMLDFGSSEQVSGLPQERRGSTRDIDRILTAAQEKVYRAKAAVYRNEQAKALIQWLRDEAGVSSPLKHVMKGKKPKFSGLEVPEKVEAKWVAGHETDKGYVPGAWVMTKEEAKNHPGKSVVSVWHKGRQEYWAIDAQIASQLRHHGHHQHPIVVRRAGNDACAANGLPVAERQLAPEQPAARRDALVPKRRRAEVEGSFRRRVDVPAGLPQGCPRRCAGGQEGWRKAGAGGRENVQGQEDQPEGSAACGRVRGDRTGRRHPVAVPLRHALR